MKGKQPIRELKRRVFSRCFLDLNREISRTILIGGTGRGGTTWASEVINHTNAYRVLFEPFYPRIHMNLSQPFPYYPYFRPGTRPALFTEQTEAILRGVAPAYRANSHNRRFFCRTRLIKDIFVNLMMKWMTETFPELRTILLVRHPFAVADSQRQSNWVRDPSDSLKQPDLVSDYLEPFRSLIQEVKTPFEQYVCFWCIETLIPLKQFREGEVYVLFYERLRVDPVGEAGRLFAYLSEPWNATKLQAMVDHPSITTRKNSPVVLNRDVLTAWERNLSRFEMDRGREILYRFGLDHLYGEDGMPGPGSPFLATSPDARGAI